MMDLQARIGKILFQHPISEHAASNAAGIIEQCESAAAMIISALALEEEREQGYTVIFDVDERPLRWPARRRYVTPWEQSEEEQ